MPSRNFASRSNFWTATSLDSMNTMRISILVGTLTLLGASVSHAQTSLGLSFGPAFPVGHRAVPLERGYAATLSLGIKPPLAPIGIRFEAMWSAFDLAADTAAAAQRVLGFTGNLTFSATNPPFRSLFAVGGVGIYQAEITGRNTGGDISNELGFNVGGGVRLPLKSLRASVEARYHHVPLVTGTVTFVPVTLRIQF